jgi:putative flippase GtrA
MTTWRRWWVFNGVGAMGVVVQLATLAALVQGGMPLQAAAPLSVVAAVAHNFAWHRRWTWSDRLVPGESPLAQFGRFAMANGAISLTGNTLLVPVLVGAGLTIMAAGLTAIVVCGLANYWAGDRLVFGPRVRIAMMRCCPSRVRRPPRTSDTF